MKRVLTLVAGLVLTAGLNGCCWLHGGHGGGCGGGGCAPYGAGYAPAVAPGGGCPNGQCGYGPVGYNGAAGQTAYFNGTTTTAALPATTFTPTIAGQPSMAPIATATIDPLPTF